MRQELPQVGIRSNNAKQIIPAFSAHRLMTFSVLMLKIITGALF